MFKRFVRSLPVVGVVSALLGLGGCMTSPLEEFAIGTNLIRDDVLNQLTAVDVAEGFSQYRSAADKLATASGLSAAQQTAIEEIQRQLDAGETTQEQFAAIVGEILQDTTPASPFAGLRFLGLPFDTQGTNDFADILGLTADQQQQAQSIFAALQTGVTGARGLTKRQIRSLLSSQQQVLLDSVSGAVFDQLGLSEDEQAGARLAIDLLVLKLGVNPDQESQIARVRQNLQVTVQQLYAGARDEFLQTLTADQLALLGAMN